MTKGCYLPGGEEIILEGVETSFVSSAENKNNMNVNYCSHPISAIGIISTQK